MDISEHFVEMYGQRRNPNDMLVKMRAPIDVYDMAKLIKEQAETIKELRKENKELLSLLPKKDEEVLDRG